MAALRICGCESSDLSAKPEKTLKMAEGKVQCSQYLHNMPPAIHSSAIKLSCFFCCCCLDSRCKCERQRLLLLIWSSIQKLNVLCRKPSRDVTPSTSAAMDLLKILNFTLLSRCGYFFSGLSLLYYGSPDGAGTLVCVSDPFGEAENKRPQPKHSFWARKTLFTESTVKAAASAI